MPVKIVCLGGGTGQAQVLKGLAKARVRLTSVVGVTDNGGHSGTLRTLFGIPQVGDLRSCLEALAPKGSLWSDILRHRFAEGDLAGASLGNLILAALTLRHGSLTQAALVVAKEMGLRSRVLPVSDGNSHICARLEGGKVLSGEWEILLRRPRKKILGLFHQPPLRATPEALQALRQADRIVICPGSLLTGILSCLLVRGVRQEIRRSRAQVIQIVNLMIQPGQTDGLNAYDHFRLLARHLERKPDAVLVNTGRPSPTILARYAEAGSAMVRDDGGWDRARVVKDDFAEKLEEGSLLRYDRPGSPKDRSRPHYIRHDPDKLAQALLEI